MQQPTLESSPGVNHTFLFLCGLHRSGRSVLNRMLQSHPDISAMMNTGAPDDEGEFVQNVYPKSRNYGGAGKFCFAPDAYLTEKSRLANNQNQVRLFAQWSPYWNLSKPFLMEKSSPNIISSRFLQALFPNSVFVFITRHPIAVALATQKTGLDEMAQHVEHWALAHKAMAEDRKFLKRHILIRYEDLIARPDHTLKILCDYLGITFYPSKESLITGINKEYFKLWEDYKLTRPRIYTNTMKYADIAAQFRYVFDTPYVHPMEIESGHKGA